MGWFAVSVGEAQTLGELISEQVEKYRGTPKDINMSRVARDLGVSASTLSRIKNDYTPQSARAFTPEQVETLLKALHFSTDEIREIGYKFDLRLPRYYHEIPEGAHVPVEGVNEAPYLGKISAGWNGNSFRDDGGGKRNVPDWVVRRFGLEHIFVLDVVGDSMVCENVRDSVPPGSECYFHAKMKPEIGDKIAVWLPRRDMGVLKIFRPGEGYVILESYNKHHEPIILSEFDEAVIQGVMIGKTSPEPRFHNGA